MKLNELKKQYENLCNEYVARFAYKHDLDFDFWIGDDVGSCASFNETYYFNMPDIVLDINTRQPKNQILRWQDDNSKNEDEINYKSYTLGLRILDLKQTNGNE